MELKKDLAGTHRLSSTNRLAPVLKFVKFTSAFRRVERDIPLLDEDRRENDLEHSCQLALVSWYLAQSDLGSLDLTKIIKYALIHDLVEVYAGDTPLFRSAKLRRGKSAREQAAAVRIQRQFPEFSELHQLISDYEARRDAESRFVYAADKLLPLLAIYLEKGHGWKSHSISLDMLIKTNASRIAESPCIKKYFEDAIALAREKPEYFVP